MLGGTTVKHPIPTLPQPEGDVVRCRECVDNYFQDNNLTSLHPVLQSGIYITFVEGYVPRVGKTYIIAALPGVVLYWYKHVTY